MANRNSNLNTTDKATPEPLSRRTALLETPFHQFGDDLIEHATNKRISALPYLYKLNKIAHLCAGASMVMRIVGGNAVVEDSHDQTNPDSEPPLSGYAIGVLTNMVAEICLHIADDISVAADDLREEASA